MRPISPLYTASALAYLDTSCQSGSLCRSNVASGEQMQIKCGFLAPPSAEANMRALAFLSVRTALRTSETVSLSSAVSPARLVPPPAYCTLVPAHIASRVTHSMTVPSCSPSSSAPSLMTLSNAVMSSRSDTSM